MTDPRAGIFGTARAENPTRGGGILPSFRPHYPARIARALHALAESRPDPETYARERKRILEAHTCPSE
jgi:hypothetical protein